MICCCFAPFYPNVASSQQSLQSQMRHIIIPAWHRYDTQYTCGFSLHCTNPSACNIENSCASARCLVVVDFWQKFYLLYLHYTCNIIAERFFFALSARSPPEHDETAGDMVFMFACCLTDVYKHV